jgi:hypothetical protein
LERAATLVDLIVASASATLPRGVDALVIRDYELDKYTPKGCGRRSIEWAGMVSETRIGSQRLVDHLRYDGISLWWFIERPFFSTAKEAVLVIEQTERLLQEQSPKHVLIMGMGNLGGIIATVCDRHGVEYTLRGSKTDAHLERLLDELKIAGGQLLIRRKERRRKRMIRPEICSGPSEGRRILFFAPSVNWRSAWNYEKGMQESRDVYMGGVIGEARRRGYEAICVDVDYPLEGTMNVLREKTETRDVAWIPFERYLGDDVVKTLRANPNYPKLKQAYRFISRSSEFRERLEYHSIPLWIFLRSRLRRLFSELHILNYARLIEGARKMLRTERPGAVCMTYETGVYAKAVIAAGQEAGIHTVAIQHGFLSAESIEYMHSKSAVTNLQEGCPIPTKTAVGGAYAARLLTRVGSYPTRSVVVTGYPKYDQLAELKKHESVLRKEQILKSLGLSPLNKTIMLASGAFLPKYGSRQEYDRYILESMLNLFSRRRDIQLIIRLHPMEDGRMQARLIEGRRVPVAIVKGEKDELVWASDLFVTVNSTTALEALILGKQVLMLDVSDTGVPSVDLGNAVVKFRLDDLHTCVEAAIDRPITALTRRAIARQVERHANTVDGRASARVMNVLSDLM